MNLSSILDQLGVRASRNGRELVALCPHPGHADSKPSWSVRDQPGHPEHGSHHCFSCGWGGGPVELVQAALDVDWEAAEAWLQARRDADPLPGSVAVTVREAMRATRLALPAGVMGTALALWPEVVRRYAVARGVTPEQVERWGIGYAIDGRCEGRMVIPTRDAAGELLWYAARAFDGRGPRYLYPRGEDGGDREALFGQQHWTGDVVTVCEGAIDALALERAGASAVAALGGSRLTAGQVTLLSRFRVLMVATDSDDAGKRAAEEIRTRLGRWRDVRRLRIPEGQDAATLSREALSDLLSAAT